MAPQAIVTNRAGNQYPSEVPVGATVSIKPVNAGISKVGLDPTIPTTASAIIPYSKNELR